MRTGIVEAFVVALALLLASISAQSRSGDIVEVVHPMIGAHSDYASSKENELHTSPSHDQHLKQD